MMFILARSSWKKLPEVSGIYMICCRWQRHVYIGSTFNFKDRFGKHLSKLHRQKHPNKDLQKLFNRKQVLFFKCVKTCNLIGIHAVEQRLINQYHEAKSIRLLNLKKTAAYYRRKNHADFNHHPRNPS